MIFREFGNKNNPVICLFHGGGLSWWSLKPQIENLQKNYHVVTPIIHKTIADSTLKVIPSSGHGEISLLRPNEYLSLLQELFDR